MNNHTHQIVKVKSPDAIASWINQLPSTCKTNAMKKWENFYDQERLQLNAAPNSNLVGVELSVDKVLERQMNSFLASYANYYNDKYHRKGGLFQRPFKRLALSNDAHLLHAIIYTHANPQKHCVTQNFKHYPYSSYHKVLLNDQYYIHAGELL